MLLVISCWWLRHAESVYVWVRKHRGHQLCGHCRVVGITTTVNTYTDIYCSLVSHTVVLNPAAERWFNSCRLLVSR